MHTDSETLKGPGKKLGRTGRLAGRTATIAATVAALTVGGIAAANWTVPGSGAGGATATTVADLTVSISAASELYPGATVDGALTVENENPFPVRITAVTFSGDVVVTDGGDCTPANSGVTFTDNITGLTIDVPANAEEFASALEDAITMSTSSNTACQGKVFSRPFTITAEVPSS